jgi:Transposase DDE domain group 1
VVRISAGGRRRQRVRAGAPDRSLTANAGLAAITELCDRLGVIKALDQAAGPIKQRNRGFGAGELLAGIAAAQLAGEDFLTGLDRQRADAAGQQITPVPGLASTTAAGLARRITPAQWRAVESGLAAVTGRMLSLLPALRAAALADGPVTIDLDTTDVEVYGRKKRGVAYNHQGQRVGRPHVATWAETETVLAADLGDGTDDPRATAPDLLRRALAGLPQRARQSGRVAMRADAGYFAGQLARAAHDEQIAFAIGAKRIAPLWRLLAGIADDAWHDAIGMDGAQVAVAEYCPDWWPANTQLLIRRVALDPAQVSADPRSRRRRTLHPDQRGMLFPELAQQPAVYAYSFILTNLDVSSPDKAIAAEHWYRHRTTVENIFRDSKLGAALRHLPPAAPR